MGEKEVSSTLRSTVKSKTTWQRLRKLMCHLVHSLPRLRRSSDPRMPLLLATHFTLHLQCNMAVLHLLMRICLLSFPPAPRPSHRPSWEDSSTTRASTQSPPRAAHLPTGTTEMSVSM